MFHADGEGEKAAPLPGEAAGRRASRYGIRLAGGARRRGISKRRSLYGSAWRARSVVGCGQRGVPA